MICAIPTVYRGVQMRSRLEAAYAEAFDALGIVWQYEPQGYIVDGMPYLPDFYLPAMRVIVEVKGPMVPGVDKTVALGRWVEEEGETGSDWWSPQPLVVVARSNGSMVMAVDWSDASAARCAGCGGWYIMADERCFECRLCGRYDGDGHIAENIDRMPGIMRASGYPTERRLGA